GPLAARSRSASVARLARGESHARSRGGRRGPPSPSKEVPSQFSGSKGISAKFGAGFGKAAPGPARASPARGAPARALPASGSEVREDGVCPSLLRVHRRARLLLELVDGRRGVVHRLRQTVRCHRGLGAGVVGALGSRRGSVPGATEHAF